MIQQITISVIAFICVILFAVFNGQFIRWDRTTGDERKLWSKEWHAVGMTIKVMIGIIMLVALFPNWLLMATTGIIYTLLSFTVYNTIINIYLEQKWYYIGGTSTIDKWGRKNPVLFWGSQAFILLLAIAVIIVMLKQ